MTGRPADARATGVTDIVRQAIRSLPRTTKRGLTLAMAAWLAVVALHVWDAQDRPGPRAMAEVASVLLSTAGLLLIGLIEVLRRVEEPAPASLPMLLQASGDAAVPAREPLRRILLALPALAVLSASFLSAAIAMIAVRVFLGTSPVLFAIGAIYLAGLVAALRVASLSARRLYAFGQRESARVARAEAQLADARLAALQAQMHPHFLFNALNTVASLVRTNPPAAEATVENLSDVLRATLQRSGRTLVAVRDEIEFVRAYLAVERQRFGDRLCVEWNVDPDALEAALPPFTIQPLVENSIKHGFAHRRDGGRIRVSVRRAAGNRLGIEVADNGDGFTGRVHEGTGLANLRRRLEVLFGSSGTVDIDSSDAGTCVCVGLPVAEAGLLHARVDR